MSPVEVVRAFWERMRERDWDGVRATLASDAVAVWPETNERFAGAEAIVRVNAEYPEGWDIRVLRLVESGDTVVAEVEVPHEGVGVFRVAAFTEVVDGLIARSMEYWVQVGGAEPPAWRSGVATRVAPGGLEAALCAGNPSAEEPA
ncbi:nuclear transport factor 2 family protein [Galactobacter valiniphilus]|uniref:nuclear transport factor 2 family protein n=1 Tax=Galactobacter valiniphilus TaxID=2676122 RepID=UPI0037362F90